MRYITPQKQLYMLLGLLIFVSLPAFTQDSNVRYPVERIERLLSNEDVRIERPRGARFKGDKAMRVLLVGENKFFIYAKLKAAPEGGEEINNKPRYEIAAYRLQKLFLDPEDYIVPPTAGRGFPVDTLRELEIHGWPTFENTESIFCTLQYWLNNVSPVDIYSKKRFKSDTSYARHFSNFNILTYLIQHSDSNEGNALISTDPENPRVFAVDNGVSFGDIYGQRGYKWRKLLVKHLPVETVARLRALRLEDFQQALGVVAQYKTEHEQLIPMDRTDNFDSSVGIRHQEGMIQLGLKEKEIRKVYDRLKELLQKVDSGKIRLF